jgi:hypothetical protein
MNRYAFVAIIGTAVFLLSIDVSIGGVADFLVPLATSFLGITLFVCICAVFSILTVILLRIVRDGTFEILRNSRQLRILYLAALSAQVSMLGIMGALLIGIVFLSEYPSMLLILESIISPLSAGFITIISSLILFSWYRSNKSAYVVLIFGVAFVLTSYSVIYLVFSSMYSLLVKGWLITPSSEVAFLSDTFQPGSPRKIMADIYSYAGTFSSLLFIAGSASMLHHYSRDLGRIKFWTLVLLPSVYLISTLADTLGVYVPETDSEFFNYYLYYSLNGVILGFTLGLSFWIISRTMKANKAVSNYLMLSAYGFLFFYIANSASVSVASYPPFGFASFALLPLSSYMVILGLFSTAISISQDVRLRQYIKDLTKSESFLGTIGQAQMEKQIKEKAFDLENIVKEQRIEIEKTSGVQSSIREQDIKQYLLEVLEEVDRHKTEK